MTRQVARKGRAQGVEVAAIFDDTILEVHRLSALSSSRRWITGLLRAIAAAALLAVFGLFLESYFRNVRSSECERLEGQFRCRRENYQTALLHQNIDA